MGKEKTNLGGLEAFAEWSHSGLPRNVCTAWRHGAYHQAPSLKQLSWRGCGKFGWFWDSGKLGSCYMWSWEYFLDKSLW